MRSLNLAAQPFRNERLGEALFAAGAVGLLALTVWHAAVIRDLLPARTSALHREVAALEAELASLRQEGRSGRTETPPAPVLAQWTLVKDLVDRRAFSWTGLFASLEEVIPEDVRLTSITPVVRKGQVELDLTATVRSASAGWEFVRALGESEEFHDVYPMSETDREFRYTMRYRPRRERTLVGPPAPSPDASPAPEASPAEEASPAPLVGPPAPGREVRP
jgi:Tfp pilus assembly protein PilN